MLLRKINKITVTGSKSNDMLILVSSIAAIHRCDCLKGGERGYGCKLQDRMGRDPVRMLGPSKKN